MSDQLTIMQLNEGLREADERFGLSVGQKKMLYDNAMRNLKRGSYPADTVWDSDGNPWTPTPNGLLPARPDIQTAEDFGRAEKASKAYDRAADRIFPIYQTLYPDDDPEDVQQAYRALAAARGFTATDIVAIAEDDRARAEALEWVHQGAQEIAYQRRYGGSGNNQGYADDGDDGRSDFGVSGVAVGGRGQAQQSALQSHQAHEKGSISEMLDAMQRKAGLKI
ncbi:hypothetical protein I6F11_23380 [Ensifer sp. NBAIM29]|nr:hypothetical protein [Ensifer sp. NBAIM29]